jgi:hypothetical protein
VSASVAENHVRPWKRRRKIGQADRLRDVAQEQEDRGDGAHPQELAVGTQPAADGQVDADGQQRAEQEAEEHEREGGNLREGGLGGGKRRSPDQGRQDQRETGHGLVVSGETFGRLIPFCPLR